MNPPLTFHQIRFDVRRTAWVSAAYWILCLTVPCLLLVLGARFDHEVRESAGLLGMGLGLAAGLVLLFTGLATTPFSGSTGFWMTRPITRGDVFLGKSLWLFLMVALPPALGWAAGAWMLGLTGAQIATGIVLVAATVHVPVLAVAVLVALATSKSERLILAAAFGGSVIASLVLVAAPGRWILTRRESAVDAFEAMLESRAIVLLLALLAGFGAAWWLAAARNRRRPSLILLHGSLLAGLLLAGLWRHDFLAAPPLPDPPVVLRLRDAGEAPDSAPSPGAGTHLVWSTLRFDGLGPRELILPEFLDANLTPVGDSGGVRTPVPVVPSPPITIRRVDHQAALRIIAADFPDAKSWSVDHTPQWSHLGIEAPNGSRHGSFEGTFGGLVVDLRQDAVLPLEPGAGTSLEGGGSVHLLESRIVGNALRVTARFDLPHLVDAGKAHPREASGASMPVWSVLHHPASGYAAFRPSESIRHVAQVDVTPIRSFLGVFEFTAPELRIGLLGETMESWLNGTRLAVYSARPTGRIRRDFSAESFTIPTSSPPDAGVLAAGSGSSTERIGPPTDPLPPDAPLEVVREHLDQMIHATSDQLGYGEFERQLMALPAAALGPLADRVPCNEMVDAAILRVLSRRLTEVPDEALVRGVSRSPRFIGPCLEAGLDDAIRPVVRALLARRVPMPYGTTTDAVRCVTLEGLPADDPTLAGDLQWHFARAGGEVAQIAEVLEPLPGFDFRQALESAWPRVAGGRTGGAEGLAPYALPLGEREALRLSLVNRRRLPEGSDARRNLEERLAAVLDLPGRDATERLALADARFPEIRWDADSGAFRIE